MGQTGSLRSTLRLDVPLSWFNSLDVLWQFWIVLAGSHILESFLIQLYTFSYGLSEGERLRVLLQPTVLTSVKDSLFLKEGILLDKVFENSVGSLCVNILTPYRLNASRVGPWSRIETNEAGSIRFIRWTECRCTKGRLLELRLLNDRLTEDVFCAAC